MANNNKNFKVTTDMPALPEVDGKSELSFFDQSNNDINLFNLVDDEIIRISGSEMVYYKYFRSTETHDDVYMEERSKVISSDGLLVHGHYDPKVVEENLTEFGIEISNDQLFTFNKTYIANRIGRDPIPGDIIKPKFQNQKYEIFQVQEDSFEMYGVYHIICSAKLLRDTEDTQDTPLTETSDEVGRHLNVR